MQEYTEDLVKAVFKGTLINTLTVILFNIIAHSYHLTYLIRLRYLFIQTAYLLIINLTPNPEIKLSHFIRTVIVHINRVALKTIRKIPDLCLSQVRNKPIHAGLALK